MNKDQIKGTAKDIAGKVQQAAGKAIDNHEMQVKGLHKQAVGKAEKAIGDAKQGIESVRDIIKRDTNTR
jgi:uncharacterized protein YjbJ (UPF0337 family)